LRSLTDWYSWMERARFETAAEDEDEALEVTVRRVRENMVR
jgi:hypothetical protein